MQEVLLRCGLLFALPLATTLARAVEYRFPADANIIDVKRDCGARGDGVADDTAALKKAIQTALKGDYRNPRMIYLPAGIYVVGEALKARINDRPEDDSQWCNGWRSGLFLAGESRERTVIRLRDACPGFTDPARPQAVVITGSTGHGKNHDTRKGGWGNEGFQNTLMNFTVDTGRGNPGANGVDFLASNRGTMEEISVRSGDPDKVGVCGIDCRRVWPGPALVHRPGDAPRQRRRRGPSEMVRAGPGRENIHHAGFSLQRPMNTRCTKPRAEPVRERTNMSFNKTVGNLTLAGRCAFLLAAGIASKTAQGADAAPAALPPDSAYVVVKDGHLSLNGERIRLWGAIGSFPGKQETRDGDPYWRQREAVRRVQKMGFNAFRIWHLSYDDTYAKGDLSATDISDAFMAECSRQGVRIWAAGFGGGRLYEDMIELAVKTVDDPATAAEWQQAVKAMCKKHWWSGNRTAISLLTPAVAWDARLEALAIAQMKQKAMHLNKYTGLRHADDPTIAIWELTNEQWWVRNMVSGQWKELPAFFRRELLAKWHAFLRGKYGGQEKLTQTWGFLLPGEDLARETVLLAPMAKPMKAIELNDANPAALEAFRTVADQYSRDDFTRARGADVLEFLDGLILSHKQRFAAQVKTWGKSSRLCPLIYDTGIGESIHSQWLHQHADAVAHAAYMEGVQLEKLDPLHRRWPWYSGLDRPPRLANDVPWLEHNRIAGKPFLCYETQFGSPSKYRAEWPSRLAALASVQDWDAVCFHYWTFNNYDFGKGQPYGGVLARPGPGAFQYDYTTDEIEFSQMRAAGAVFRNLLVAPAPQPTTFTYGRPALFDPASMDYAGSYGRAGLDMNDTAYRYGLRMAIDTNQTEFVKTDGPVVRFNGYEQPNPIRPNDQVEFDYQRGHLRCDAPGVAAYTGFFGQYGAGELRFRNGVALANVTHRDPEGTPYPSSPNERFMCFTLASEDGQPLGQCRKAVLSLVASSFNTGLKIDREQRKVLDYGKAPVLVTRVGATVTASQLAGMQWRMLDFNENLLAHGTIAATGQLLIPADQPVFVIELNR